MQSQGIRQCFNRTHISRTSACRPMHFFRPLSLPKALPHHQAVSTQEQQAQQHHQCNQQTKRHCYQELDNALDQLGGGKFQALLLSCICLVWAGDAAEVMVLSYLGPAASCNFGFDSPTSQSLLTSSVFAGMLLGAASWGFLADELGRRKALLASTAVVVGAGLASSAAPTPTLLLLSRACVGFGLAGAPVAFTLMMECLPARSRALWGVLIELAWTVGTIAEAALAWAVLNTQGWRVLLLLSTGPLVLLLVLVRWLPESPRWLLAQGDSAGAASVLQQISRINGKPTLHLPHLTTAANMLATSGTPATSITAPTAAAPANPAAASGTQRQRHRQRPPPREGLRGSSMESDAASETAALLSDKSSSSTSSSSQPPSQGDIELQASPQYSQQSTSSTPRAQAVHEEQLVPSQHSPLCPPSDQDQQQHKAAHSQAPKVSNSIHKAAAEVQHALGMLWGGSYATTTNLLVLSWAAVACAYYGLVQLDGQLHIQAAAGSGGSAAACVDGQLQVPSSDYAAVMVTAAAEVPAVAWAAAVSKGFGGSKALVASLVLGCACLLPAIANSALYTGVAQAAGGAGTSWSSSLTELSMFGSRLFVSAAFALLWVFTPPHYPTRVRGFGLGISNACGRLGGLLSPFVAINLASTASPAAAEAVFAGLCLAAAGAVALTPHGHTTQEQQMEEEEDDEE